MGTSVAWVPVVWQGGGRRVRGGGSPPLLVAAAGWVLLRAWGAGPGMAGRLGGAREIKVGRLLDIGPDDDLPRRPVRVVGRIRCGDPIVTAEDDRLVAVHRDVEVPLPRRA